MSKQKDSYVLGSDLGTSGCKTIVLDADGRICGRAFREYPTSRPHPGWAEQHPNDWFDAFCVTARKAIDQAGIHPKTIAAVSIVGITHNVVLLDERDEVLRPSIIYTDTRSLEQSKVLQEQWGDRVFRKTWNQLSPIWTWPQLLWLREEEPHIWERVRKILFPKDYVRYRLVPMFVTDKIDPIGTLLYDPINGQWIDEFCNSLGLPAKAFPQSVSPLQVVGKVSKSSAEVTGLYPGTPVIAGTTDTAAEVFGTGALTPGQTIIKLATVGRIAAVSQNPLDHPTVLNYPHVLPGLWYPGTCTKFAASAFSWARQVFWDHDGNHYDYKLMDQAVETVPPGAEGLLFHPYLAGEFAPSFSSIPINSFIFPSTNLIRMPVSRENLLKGFLVSVFPRAE